MNELLTYNRIGSVAKERAPAYVAEVKKPELKAPTNRVQEVAPQTTQISLKKEETPLKHQTDLYIRTAEVIEKGEKVEKKLDDSADVITRFKKVASEQDPTKKLAEKEEFIKKFDSYKKETDQSNIENTHRGNTKSYEQELVTRTAERIATKVGFKKEKVAESDSQFEDKNDEVSQEEKANVDLSAKTKVEIKSIALPVEQEKETIKSKRTDIAVKSRDDIIAKQKTETRSVESPTNKGTEDTEENNVSLGDLVESLRTNLTAKKEKADERKSISFENSRVVEEDNSSQQPLPALTKAEFDLDKVDSLLYQSHEKSKELVKVISDTPASTLNSGLPPQLLNYLDRTLNDIKETRVTMKQMKQSYETTSGKEAAPEPRAQLKTIDKIEDAKKVIKEITQMVSPDNFRKAQQIITPEAVSQLLF